MRFDDRVFEHLVRDIPAEGRYHRGHTRVRSLGLLHRRQWHRVLSTCSQQDTDGWFQFRVHDDGHPSSERFAACFFLLPYFDGLCRDRVVYGANRQFWDFRDLRSFADADADCEPNSVLFTRCIDELVEVGFIICNGNSVYDNVANCIAIYHRQHVDDVQRVGCDRLEHCNGDNGGRGLEPECYNFTDSVAESNGFVRLGYSIAFPDGIIVPDEHRHSHADAQYAIVRNNESVQHAHSEHIRIEHAHFEHNARR